MPHWLTCGGGEKKGKGKSISPVKVYFILMTVYNWVFFFFLLFKGSFTVAGLTQSSERGAYLGQG